jgi:hypothetical protein
MGSGGMAGAGGGGGCVCPVNQECMEGGGCIDPHIIDDFADCNTSIYPVRGRTGAWYGAADTGINLAFAVGTPPTGFSDHRCGAWTTGGPKGVGPTNFGLIGVSLLQNSQPYSLSMYTGFTVALEAQSVDFTVKTTNAGYFVKRLPTTTGTQTFDIDFASLTPRSDSVPQVLDKSKITDIQFTILDASVGYSFVIHGLWLR